MEAAAHTRAPDAVILAGGEGRRLGGRDKGLIPLAGSPLALHVAARLRPHCAVVWLATRNPAAYAGLGLPAVDDGAFAGNGPLAGIRAALAASTAEALIVAPCDAPLLPDELVGRLCRALVRRDAAYAHDGRRAHYACAALRCTLRPRLESFLAAGGRALGVFLAEVGAVAVDFADHADAFMNINTPAELSAARRMLEVVP